VRRWLLVLLAGFLGVVLILGWHLRELAGATDESARELGATRERVSSLERDLQNARAEIDRLRRQRERLDDDLRAARSRVDRQVLIDEITAALEKLRGLTLRRPLRVRWVDPAFTRRFVRDAIARQIPKGGLQAYAATLSKLGLLPAGYDLARSVEELLGDLVAGFYDHVAAVLHVRSDAPAGEYVLAHEIAHALQDQHHALAELLRPRLDHDDRGFALRALVEGDALLVMELYLRQTLSLWKLVRLLADVFSLLGMDEKKLEATPLYLRETLVRSYLDGKAFVETLRRAGGWARVERAFREPPQSSEQILHPEKYLRGERPLRISLPDLGTVLGPGWTVLHENTVGELGASALLRGAVASRKLAAAAAEGWGGDRLRCYQGPGGRLLLVWRTAWDTTRDASEFRRALSSLLDERHGRALEAGRRWSSPGGTVLIAGSGRQVLLVDGAVDLAQAERIAAATAATR
jgi:hypothetical protein